MTIKDIAKETGFSIGTVSRVLNNHPNVSEETRRIVNEAVKKHGFILNTAAKNLKQRSTNSIAVIVKGNSNELFASLVEKLQSLCLESKYTLITDYIDEENNEVLRARELIQDQKVLGIFFLGGNSENFNSDFDKIECPCVLVTDDAENLGFSNLSSVTTNDLEAAMSAVDYLFSKGHRKIALLGGTPRSDTSYLRRKGYELANVQHGVSKNERGPFVAGRFTFEAGYEGMKKLLEAGEEFTAAFAIADVVAIGAISAVNDFGKRVPEDISIMGFDGIRICEYYCPKITTIEQDVEELAKRSFKILIDSIENGTPARHETVMFKIRERSSVADIIS